MIRALLRISWLNLRRDRVALALTFVLPLILFSIVASVFEALEARESQPVPTALVLEGDDAVSLRLAEMLRRQPGLDVVRRPGTTDDRDEALRAVRSGELPVAVIVPAAVTGEIEVLADRSNPLATAIVRAALQQVALEAAASMGGSAQPGLRVTDVLGGGEKRSSVAYFAAGIGVLFLLFTVSGRSAILIEERESGVLTRMLAARVSLTQLLAGRWLFLSLLGAVQVTVMFVWGALVFDVELWTPRHLAGFLVMTLVTAACAAAFGLLLSSLCRSRAQLNGVAAVTILILSALGGSMFPRFLMPEGLQQAGLWTFNGWALTGYQKVFWYESAPLGLWPEALALCGFCTLFLAAARWFAGKRRIA